mmetsp:Transcript_10788/g.44214  ORF Transcript_10788/g.44214 Transcript_10788/m.44214 type:complete len:446 (+) Transcript_10788:404-1741(+)
MACPRGGRPQPPPLPRARRLRALPPPRPVRPSPLYSLPLSLSLSVRGHVSRSIFDSLSHTHTHSLSHTHTHSLFSVFSFLTRAREYNGEHHYEELPFFGPLEAVQRRDMEKRRICEESGIRLLTVPYWWDRKLESLAASIHELTPGLLGEATPEKREKKAETVVQQVLKGQHEPISPFLDTWKPLLKKQPKLPQALSDAVDPAGYLMSESYTGTRVRWSDGEVATVEQGRILEVPAWWKAQLPPRTELEGYLWMGPGGSVGKLSRFLAFSAGRQPAGGSPTADEERAKTWRDIKFVAFDLPTNDDFGDRAEVLRALPANDVLLPIRYEVCAGREHMNRRMNEVTSAGGEGLQLRYPRDTYDGKRTQETYFRIKAVQKATVTMREASPTLNCLIVEAGAGKTQTVRCSSQAYEQPPPPGSRLVVGHIGQWDSGRYKYPFLLHEEDE